jgi:hypothetical protein
MIFDVERVTKSVGAVTAVFAMIGGGYTAFDKLGLFRKPILEWSPEHFSITDGAPDGEFAVVAARRKIRDDCSVEQFYLEVRDARYIVHKANPSIAKFSGPATDKVDKFGYTITIEEPSKVAPGRATLLAHIRYKCPEGDVLINYPDHANLTFNIAKQEMAR